MKKLLLTLCALSMMMLSANAWEASERVETVGKTLLEKNGLPTAITFKVVEGVADNSQATTTNIINISKDDLTCAGNDSEVAAAIVAALFKKR